MKNGRIDLAHPDNTASRSVGPGDHFGERALLGDRTWQLTATAAEPTTLIAIEAEVFDTITRADTSIRDLLLKTASRLPVPRQRA